MHGKAEHARADSFAPRSAVRAVGGGWVRSVLLRFFLDFFTGAFHVLASPMRGPATGYGGDKGKGRKGQQQYLFDHSFVFFLWFMSSGFSSERRYAAARCRSELWGVGLAMSEAKMTRG